LQNKSRQKLCVAQTLLVAFGACGGGSTEIGSKPNTGCIDQAAILVLRWLNSLKAARQLIRSVRRLKGAALLKVFFYLANGPEEPLGGEEFWLTAAPRMGETVCVLLGEATSEQSLFGKVVDLQWTVQKRDDGDSEQPDWITVDVWLEPLSPQPGPDKA
jgi:hypothetical protein